MIIIFIINNLKVINSFLLILKKVVTEDDYRFVNIFLWGKLKIMEYLLDYTAIL